MVKAAYIHIPFCRRRCYYCDFPVSVIGDRLRGETSHAMEDYVTLLCQEIKTQSFQKEPLTTIFFGGGTPSLLSVSQLEKILFLLDKKWGIASDAEISMEVDPGTFNLEHLQGYVKAGVNRVSLGAQSFQGKLLQKCGRFHTVEDIFTAVDIIHQVGIVNFNLDLISGLPSQTLWQWQDSLEKAIALSPQHLSCYDLVLEPVTAFGKRYEPGEIPLPSDETTAQMYRMASQVLRESGYFHYEISNYAQPGYLCRHNQVYWRNLSYYGFGMGATSYLQRQRFTRPRTRKSYFDWVEKFQKNQGIFDCSMTPQEDEILETLMLGLRLSEGVDLNRIEQQFGTKVLEAIQECIQPFLNQGWIEIQKQEQKEVNEIYAQGRVKLTDPEGFLFSNRVLATLFQSLARDF